MPSNKRVRRVDRNRRTRRLRINRGKAFHLNSFRRSPFERMAVGIRHSGDDFYAYMHYLEEGNGLEDLSHEEVYRLAEMALDSCEFSAKFFVEEIRDYRKMLNKYK